MPSPGQTGQRRHNVLFVRPLLLLRQHILNRNEPILMLSSTSGTYTGQGRETTNFEGQEIKGQGHKKPKFGLETGGGIILDPWVDQLL